MTKTYQKPRLTATLFLLAALLFPIKSLGETTITVGDLNYVLNEEAKTAEVTGCSNGSVSNLEIPGSIQSGEVTYTVTSIKANAFSALTNVTIPASVETIGDHAFKAETLKTVTFEEGSKLKSIGAGAFAGFKINEFVGEDVDGSQIYEDVEYFQLTSINLEVCTQLETIGNEAFHYSKLSKIIIPASVNTIGKDAFADPYHPLTVKFRGTTPPTSVANLNAAKILVPASALAAYQEKFANSTPYYFAGEDVTVDGITYTVQADEEHYAVKSITSSAITDGKLTIPGNVNDCEVNAINEEAAKGLGSLTTLTIPASVETIGYQAFYQCTGLSTVTFEEGSRLKSIGTEAFAGYEDDSNISYDEGGLPTGEIVFVHQLSSINLEACTQLETIGDRAFHYSKLSKIIIPASVKTIGTCVFDIHYHSLTVKFCGTTPPTFNEDLYVDKILVPASALAAYQETFGNSVTPYYFAGEETTVDGITYIMGEDEEHFAVKSITGSAISAGAITIAKDVNGYAVTSISNNALDNFDNEIEYIIVAEENYESLQSNAGGYENKVYVNGGTKALNDGDALVLNDKYLYTSGNITYSRTFTGGEYATMCLPLEVAVDALKKEFAEVYLPQSNIIHNTSTGKYIMMLMTPQEQTIAAGVPFFVKRSQEGEQTVALKNASTEVLATTLAPKNKELSVVDWDGTSGLMTQCPDVNVTYSGTLAARTDFDDTFYTFNADGSFGNQRADSNFPAYRMYLNITDKSNMAAPIRMSIGIFGDDDNTTGIMEVVPAELKASALKGIYTIDGRTVNGALSKGLYIMNGKKVIVK
ncbi:MAG: leucine-rich repeat domain-containing protein [Prevotella sp.]|nr:leucine-rich repeat domain-containing protein [Prevotella sp.]